MRKIKDTEYTVDIYGNVFNPKGKKLSLWKENNTGYWLVRIRRNKKPVCYRVHRLVAEAYLPNPLGLPFVKHKDDIKENNEVTNLEWGANPDNTQEGYDNGCYLSNKRSYRISITDLKLNLTSYYPSLRQAEEQLGINRKAISAILKGKRKQLESYHIKLED